MEGQGPVDVHYEEVPVWHIEGGEGSNGKVAKFQMRPDPLAH